VILLCENSSEVYKAKRFKASLSKAKAFGAKTRAKKFGLKVRAKT